EYVITQSNSFKTNRQGKENLERQMKQLSNAEDGSVTQNVEMKEAIDQLIQGEFAMGENHYSLMIFGESMEKLRRNST
ncbi:hypothetical protein ACPTFP_31210, partial [Pseudomonas aeruginosa]|uniref:VirB4 family type IV secretion/conjugal transfer ATPase n=1 Tax=Pseudomonas aeruginosa TaxID=287 RepID=UPI003CC5A4BE